jgi:hypothetical protein
MVLRADAAVAARDEAGSMTESRFRPAPARRAGLTVLSRIAALWPTSMAPRRHRVTWQPRARRLV